MLILFMALVLGTLLFTGAPRLDSASEGASRKKVRAYVDGKPVDSYIREEDPGRA